MKKFAWGILVVLVQMPIWLFGQNYESNIRLAERYYADANYDSAAMAYQKVLDEGYHSAELYYNLGNSFYKQNQIPSAILYYEKAKKLAPTDEDIVYNLGIANSMIADKIEKVPVLFYQHWWDYFYNLFDADTWTIISLFAWLILLLFIGIFILKVRDIVSFRYIICCGKIDIFFFLIFIKAIFNFSCFPFCFFINI